MKSTNIKYLVLALPLLLTGLAGCGKSSGHKSSSAESQTSSQTSSGGQSSQSSGGGQSSSTVDPEVKSVKVKFWHTFGQTIVDGLKSKITAFKAAVKEHDGVDVDVEMTYQGGYDDIAKKISDGYSVNNRPTIAVAYPDNVADYLEIGKSNNEQFVVNLDKFINSNTVGFGKENWLGDKYGADDFVSEFFEEGSRYAQAGTYSLPYMKSTEIMFYNMKLLKKAMPLYNAEIGNSEEKIKRFMKTITWDEFIDLNTVIKNNMSYISNNLEIPFLYDSDANYLVTKLFQNDIPYTTVDQTTGQADILFGKGEALNETIRVLEEAHDYYENGIMTTKGIRGTYGSDFFTGEKAVFSIGSSGGSGYNFPQAEAFELGVCRVPDANNNPIYVSQGPTLALFSDRGLDDKVNEATQLYAWKFMKYITNGETNAELCIEGSEGYVPVRYSAYETEYFREFMEEGEDYAKCYEVVVQDVDEYLITDAFKGSAALRDEVGTLLTASLRESKSNIPANIQTAIDNARLKM